MFTKKSISAVVSIALILLISVATVAGFATWYNNLSSGIWSGVEKDNPINGIVKVEAMTVNDLYLSSEGNNYLSSLKIKELNGSVKCSLFNGNAYSSGGDTRLLLSFNDGTATDLSGYGNDGTLNGGVDCSVSGIDGYGCLFDGVDDYVAVGNDTSVSVGAQDWTISIWYKLNDDLSYLISKITNEGDKEYSIYTWNYYRVQVDMEKNSNDIWLFTENYTYSLSRWHNTIVTFDAENLKLKIYQNGIEKNVQIKNGAIELVDVFSANLEIGRRGGSIYQDAYTDGTIDEVAIYSKALTNGQVQALYKSKKALMYEQLIDSEMKSIDLSSCNLEKGRYYEVVGVANSQVIQRKMLIE